MAFGASEGTSNHSPRPVTNLNITGDRLNTFSCGRLSIQYSLSRTRAGSKRHCGLAAGAHALKSPATNRPLSFQSNWG